MLENLHKIIILKTMLNASMVQRSQTAALGNQTNPPMTVERQNYIQMFPNPQTNINWKRFQLTRTE